MAKTNRCVVRNEAYRRGAVANMERHNERKNQHYGNGDVDTSRSEFNVHFKECDSTYLQAFDRMVDDGSIRMWNAKKDPKIIDEMIFDVNTEYFEQSGGYEYAKQFFAEAYLLAVEIAGDERYVLSAVMHADERNKALSEQLGRDVYHYHLHVVYIPVVDSEIKWTKRCKDPALVGTVKETFKQVSNSKKWKSEQVMGDDGKKRLVYSYSLLQDRFYEHMRAAGFTGFERGERGSTAEHLDVLDYKIRQDEKRLGALGSDVQAKQKKSAALGKTLAVQKKAEADISLLDSIGKKNLVGQIVLTPEELNGVKAIVKEGVKSRDKISTLKNQLDSRDGELDQLKAQLGSRPKITERMDYYTAMQRAPRRMADTISDIMRQPPEQTAQQHNLSKQQQRRNSYDR